MAGIVDPGHSSYKQKRSLRLALLAQTDPLFPLSAQPHITSVSKLLHPAARNLAGFNRDFRFTQQKHICAIAKKKRRADVNTET